MRKLVLYAELTLSLSIIRGKTALNVYVYGIKGIIDFSKKLPSGKGLFIEEREETSHVDRWKVEG